MAVLLRIVTGVLLLAHGLVHLLYLTPDANDPNYPFTLRSSWLVPQSARSAVATALIAATVVAFALLALAIWGVPGLSSFWAPLALVGACASFALLVAFWKTQMAQDPLFTTGATRPARRTTYEHSIMSWPALGRPRR